MQHLFFAFAGLSFEVSPFHPGSINPFRDIQGNSGLIIILRQLYETVASIQLQSHGTRFLNLHLARARGCWTYLFPDHSDPFRIFQDHPFGFCFVFSK